MREEDIVPLQLSQTLFSPQNVGDVLHIMESPMRQMVMLHLEAIETLFSAILSGQGNVEDTLFALSYGAMERANDPLRILNILVTGSYHEMKHQGLLGDDD